MLENQLIKISFIQKMRDNRNSKTMKAEVYLDESYVNKNHSNDFIWYSGEDTPWVQKPKD